MGAAFILGSGFLMGAATGAMVAVFVNWEVVDFLTRHSQYKSYAPGHLIKRRAA